MLEAIITYMGKKNIYKGTKKGRGQVLAFHQAKGKSSKESNCFQCRKWDRIISVNTKTYVFITKISEHIREILRRFATAYEIPRFIAIPLIT